VSSHFKLIKFHSERSDEEKANHSLAACFAILDSFAQQRCLMDSQMRAFYGQLAPIFGPAGRKPRKRRSPSASQLASA
jgi:hypothetical protein